MGGSPIRLRIVSVSLALAVLLGPRPAFGQEASLSEPAGQRQVDTPELWSQLNLWTASGRARTFLDRETRDVLRTIDIVDRPNRPLHIYGNAVRRRAANSASFSGRFGQR